MTERRKHRDGGVRLLRALLLLLLCVLAGTRNARAQDDDPDDDVPTRCVCVHRRACYHFLHAPFEAPDEACSCPRCIDGARHAPGAELPEGWNAACFASNRLDCFLKRHAASWRITCSACLADRTCCPFPAQEACPFCGDGTHRDPFAKDALSQDARASMAEQLAIETRFFDAKDVVVAYSRRFYVVTDVDRVRLATQDGSPRWATGHEYAHLMVQRAELAYDELSQVLGGRIKLLRPMGIYLPKSERTGRALQDVYFRNARSHMIYSSYPGRSESAISGGFCLNGCCIPLERIKQSAAAARSVAGDDYAWHGTMRHMLAHVLSTCWIERNGENRTMPRWAFIGLAHWFEKRLEKHRDVVFYCTGETGKLSGSGKDWADLVRKRALAGRLAQFGELLARNSLGQFDVEDHRQLWALFDVALGNDAWRAQFIETLADLRRGRDVRDAFQEHLGMSPEAFHDACMARLLGSDIADAPAPEAPTLAGIRATDGPEQAAAAISAMGRLTSADDVAALLDLAGLMRSDRVRETALDVLLKTEDPAARRAIFERGLASARPLTRAYAARACRLLGLADARPALRPLLSDPDWLVRSEAALACATLRDFDAQSGMRALLADPSPKARIGALDALAILGTDANSTCLPLVARELAHDAWQVRIAAAQCLARLGGPEAVDALVARAPEEGGRVQSEIFTALRAIAGEDFGNDPERWRVWWEHERPHVLDRGGVVFTGPPKPPKEPDRYAPEDTPKYFGERVFSQRVMFVLDTSRSTNRNFEPAPSTRERLLGSYLGDTLTIAQICRVELQQSIDALDPRARFDVVCFASDVARWKGSLVPASEGNKRGGASFVRSRSPAGETNFHGALLAALDLDADPWSSGDLRNGADTVMFLTDGSPTVGDVTDPEQVLRWFTELNRYARAQVDVFVFGTLGVNETFLQRMAAQGGGRYVQLFETNPR